MKIERVRLVTLKHMYSDQERYIWPGARALGARAMLVEVVSDTGLSGLDEIGVGTPQLCRPVVERLGKLIIGQNAQNKPLKDKLRKEQNPPENAAENPTV